MTLREKYGEWGIILGALKVSEKHFVKACQRRYECRNGRTP